MERRLAAILAADVVGYSRLMEQDEAGTFSRLRAYRKDLFEPAIAAHHGRVFKLMGDGLLAEFASVVDAVACAVALQSGMAERNAAAAAAHRIEARIGVNLGDLIVETDDAGAADMHGEGVIIANRLQALAEPGGICVSQTVVNHVGHKVAVGFEFVGEQRVKNIAEPVRIYRVLTEAEAAGRMTDRRRTTWRTWRWPAVATMLLVVIAGALVVWQRPWQPRIEAASIENMALPLPDRPSVAVLPFANMSDDPKQDYFADGMTDGLITELSQVSGLFVISRNSTFAYKGKTVPPKQVSEELGVRYVLEGSVQRAGDRLRINAQLIDALSGGHEWADKYDGSLADVFAFQDKVARSIAEALALRLTDAEQLALKQQETRVPEAYDAFLQGWGHYQRTTPADFAKAIPYFERAIELDPNYSRASAALAMVYFRAFDQGWAGSLGITANDAFRRSRDYLAVASARPTSTSHQVAGNISRLRGWYDDAFKEFQAAIALDPNDSWSYAYLAYALIYLKRPAEATTQIETAMRLDPHHPALFVFYKGLAQFEQNQMAEAADTLETATQLGPDDPWPLLFLAGAYGHLGRKKEAVDTIAAYSGARVRQGGRPFVLDEIMRSAGASIAPPPNSPLVRGLLLAGIEYNFDSPKFDGLRLNAAELGSIVFGHRWHGRAWEDGLEYGMSIAVDGTAVKYGAWGESSGTVRLNGSQLCFESTATVFCGSVLRNPGGTKEKENEYLWFDVWAAPFSLVE